MDQPTPPPPPFAPSIGGRFGFFLILNEDGFESDVLRPQNADAEAERMLTDATGRRHALRIVWCYYGFSQDDGPDRSHRPPTYHDVGVVEAEEFPVWPSHPDGPKKIRPVGVWAACERFLFEQNTAPTDGRSGQRRI